MTVSPLDALLGTFDRHIDSRAAAAAAPQSIAGPSNLNLRRDELRRLIVPSSASHDTPSTEPQLSALERAIYYEVENRRHLLQRKAKQLDFWEAYQSELAEKPIKMPTSAAALERQIEDKKHRLRQLEGVNRLNVETSRALEASAVIQRVLSTTSPAGKKEAGEQYASTRKLLDQRDDQALEFLRVFDETRAVRQQRVAIKARIRGTFRLKPRTDESSVRYVLNPSC